MVVSEGMAKRLWPGREAIGQCVRVQRDSTCTTVVGISEDVHDRNIAGDSATYMYYLPAEQYASTPGLALRTAGPHRVSSSRSGARSSARCPVPHT